MYDLSNIKSAPLAFGTAGTASSVAASTATANPINLPRGNYGVTALAVSTVTATGTASSTSIAGGVMTWQASNDNVSWFPVSSATVLATAITSATFAAAGISTAITYVGAGFTVTPNAYAYGRAVLSSTGTGGYTQTYFSA